MFHYYFTFRSMTAAQKAVSELNKSGIISSLLRSPKAISSMGCSYAVRVPEYSGDAAVFILKTSGNMYTKIFQQNQYGSWREVIL